MNIETREERDYEKHLKTLMDKLGPEVGKAYISRWYASVEGPWYSDSNPEGRGDTEAEAVAEAVARVREIHEEITEFLKIIEGKK